MKNNITGGILYVMVQTITIVFRLELLLNLIEKSGAELSIQFVCEGQQGQIHANAQPTDPAVPFDQTF